MNNVRFERVPKTNDRIGRIPGRTDVTFLIEADGPYGTRKVSVTIGDKTNSRTTRIAAGEMKIATAEIYAMNYKL